MKKKTTRPYAEQLWTLQKRLCSWQLVFWCCFQLQQLFGQGKRQGKICCSTVSTAFTMQTEDGIAVSQTITGGASETWFQIKLCVFCISDMRKNIGAFRSESIYKRKSPACAAVTARGLSNERDNHTNEHRFVNRKKSSHAEMHCSNSIWQARVGWCPDYVPIECLGASYFSSGY